MTEERYEDCEECSGAGSTCATCGQVPDNCDCEHAGANQEQGWVECEACHGDGRVEAEPEEDA